MARLGAAGELDVLVVGGATGVGIVLEATLRGCRCALVEGADFAGGISSRWTKQIHGGPYERASEWALLVALTMCWSSAEQQQQVHAYRSGLARFRVPSGAAA